MNRLWRTVIMTATVFTLVSAAGCGVVPPGEADHVEIGFRMPLYSVSLAGENGWAVGPGGRTVRLAGDSLEVLPPVVDRDLKAVYTLDGSHAWAVGASGTILSYDGSDWTQQQSDTDLDLEGVFAVDERHAWAVGWGGSILEYDGSRWEVVRTGPEALKSVYASSRSRAWAVGSGGTILSYDGKTWDECEKITEMELTSISGLGEDVWACGLDGTVLRLQEGWRVVRSAKRDVLKSIEVTGEGVVIAGYLMQGDIRSGGVAWRGEASSFLLRYDGGWTRDEFECERFFPGSLSGEKVAGLGGLLGLR